MGDLIPKKVDITQTEDSLGSISCGIHSGQIQRHPLWDTGWYLATVKIIDVLQYNIINTTSSSSKIKSLVERLT